MKNIEIIRRNSKGVYTLFDPRGVAKTHIKVCIIKKKLGINHVAIARTDLWQQLKQKYEVEILNESVD